MVQPQGSGRSRGGYSGSQILLHWLIAALVLFQLIFGESMGEVIEAAEEGEPVSAFDQAMADAHYWVGIAILALVALRFLLLVARGAPTPIGRGWSVIAARIVHGIFYLLLVAVPTTGLLAIYISDDFGEIHEIGKPLFIAFIVIHALGALAHHFLFRDNTLKRMLVPGA
jgi:cytochrome b561